MALILDALLEVLRRPSAVDVAVELAAFTAPLWLAVLAGLVIGWAWRPRWAPVACSVGAADGVGASGAAAAAAAVDGAELASPSFAAKRSSSEPERAVAMASSPAVTPRRKELAVTDEDLRHLFRLVEVTDGGPAWMKMMDRSIPNMTYQAWRRDPETGPPQYRSSTIYEDAAADVVRDFFGDDDFRIKNGWDDMLIQFNILEECPTTGTMIVQWVRKFPFFCSDREYIIGRRIWTSGGAYYCVTKGVPYPSVPRRDRPRRVDLYYSSWCIRPAESKRDGQMTACEVLLFHHEDMGIPWEIAKLGVRQGMWSCVKKIEPGLRAYQVARTSNEPLSRSAAMAQINTKFDADQLRSLDAITESSSDNIVEAEKPKQWTCNIPKLVIVGGAVAVACTLDHGLLTKAVIFGVVRKFARLGKRL